MFQSSVDLIRPPQTRRRSEVCGAILPLKEEVTIVLCHESVVQKKNPPKGGGFRPEASFR
jgi:hypothetical protein